MARRRYVITYDISDDKRRSKVFNVLEGNGDHVQFSVFVCSLNEFEVVQLKLDLVPLIDHAKDQVLFIDLGSAEGAADKKVEALGLPYIEPCRVIVV